MTGRQIISNSESFLRHLQNLQVLQLSRSICSDKWFDIIADNCSQLKSLDVSGCKEVTDVGLGLLCEKNPPLESLNVKNTSVTVKGVALVLKKIPTLTNLSFDDVPGAILEAVGLKDFSKIKSNQIFNLSNLVIFNDSTKPARHLTAILKGCIKACPFIKDLIVSEVINKEHLKLCSQFKNVDSVRLQFSTTVNPKLSIDNFLEIRGENLTSLLLTSFSLSVEILAKCCPNLENLILRHPSFQEMAQEDIDFPHLNTFSLQFVQSAPNQLPASRIISASPNLKELHILFSTLSEEMQEAVLRYPKQLKILNFSDTDVTPQFIRDILEEHKGLSTLTLRHAGISIEDYYSITAIINERQSKLKFFWEDEPNGDEYDVVHNSYKRMRLMIRIRRA